MRAWLDVIARTTGAGVLVMDAAMKPLHAEARALALLSCASEDDLAACLQPFANRLREWGDAAATESEVGGELLVDGAGAVKLVVRVFALREPAGKRARYLVLIGDQTGRPKTALTDFARQLGHDLRGPLNAMVLNLDLMRISVEGGDDPDAVRAKRLRYLENMQREIDRLSEVLVAAEAQGNASDV